MTGGFHYVGVGISKYCAQDLPLLHSPARHVRVMADTLRSHWAAAGRPQGYGFTSELLSDPTAEQVRHLLARAPLPAPDAPDNHPEKTDLLVIWSGHGEDSADGLVLAVADTETTAAAASDTEDVAADWDPAVAAEQLILWAAGSGARQLLLVVNCCHAGAADAVAGIADRIANSSEAVAAAGGFRWLGLLTAATTRQEAGDGLLTHHLHEVVRDGPRPGSLNPLAWSASQPLVSAQDVVLEVLDRWKDAVNKYSAQLPGYRANLQYPGMLNRDADHWVGMFPNPRYEPGTGPQVVQHLLEAARGTSEVLEQTRFSGRHTEVDRVVGWVTAGTPGLRTVTGPPGAGKSAVVGRVVSLSDPDERARLFASGPPPEHADPGPRSVAANVHARGWSADELAGLIEAQLIGAAVVEPQPNGARRDCEALVAAVRLATAPPDEDDDRPRRPFPVIVLDGLDEARTIRERVANGVRRRDAFDIAERLALPLAEAATVIVATRDLPDDSEEGRGLVKRLCGRRTPDLDLSLPEHRESGAAAIRAYVRRRLTATEVGLPAETAVAVAEHVLGAAPADTAGPFLLARVLTDQIVAHPQEASGPDWTDRLGATVGQAVRKDLAAVPAPERAELAADAPGHARVLLTSLTWGMGAGFPEAEWLAVASATARTEALLPEGAEYTAGDVRWLLEALGRHVIQDVLADSAGGDAGPAVYRIAHQGIADLLRPPFRPSPEQPFDAGAPAVLQTLLASLQRWRDAGRSFAEARYLWLHLNDHAAAAGEQGVEALSAMAGLTGDPTGLAITALAVANQQLDHGSAQRAAAMFDVAIAVWRASAETDPDVRGALAESLQEASAALYAAGDTGRALELLQEARAQFTVLMDQDHGLPGIIGDVARSLALEADLLVFTDPQGACAAADRAMKLTARPAGARWRPIALAVKLSTEQRAGRPEAALEALEEVLTTAFPAKQPPLGTPEGSSTANSAGAAPESMAALESAGLLLARLGRSGEAVAAVSRAVELLRAQFGETPERARFALGQALVHLSAVRFQHGAFPAAAVADAEEAVELLRQVHAATGQHVLLLGQAELQLAAAKVADGSPAAAYTAATSAVTRLRVPAATDPFAAQLLVEALFNLAGAGVDLLAGSGAAVTGAAEPLHHTEEAMAVLDRLLAEDPGRYTADWLAGLARYINACTMRGRPELALPRLDRGVEAARAGYRSHSGLGAGPLADFLSAAAEAVEDAAPDGDGPEDGVLRARALARAVAYTEEALGLLGPLAEQDPVARTADLAGAEQDLARLLRVSDGDAQRAEGLEVGALGRLRQAHADRPDQYVEGLAEALASRAFRVPLPEALELRAEAVDLLLPRLPADRFDQTSQLTLNVAKRLADGLAEVGREPEAVEMWQRLAASGTAGVGLMGELQLVGPGVGEQVEFLLEALGVEDQSMWRTVELGTYARTLYEEDPGQFTEHWTRLVGEPPPPWVSEATDLAAIVILERLLLQPSLESLHDLLTAHPELLAPDENGWTADIPDTVDRPDGVSALSPATLRGILLLGRRDGLAATAPQAVRERIAHFCGVGLAEQTETVLADRDFLLGVADELIPQPPDGWTSASPLTAARALIELARAADGPQRLEAVAGASAEPRQLLDLCRTALLDSLSPQRDARSEARAATSLAVLAHCAFGNGNTPGLLYYGFALVRTGELDPTALAGGLAEIAPELPPELVPIVGSDLAALAIADPDFTPLTEAYQRAVADGEDML